LSASCRHPDRIWHNCAGHRTPGGQAISRRHLIIGAGPAGLTAAFAIANAGEAATVLEADPEYVGGISRTVRYKGNRFDIGGHRFYTKSPEIEALWHEMLPGEFLQVPRLSRIYYDRVFFPYPISILPTLKGLGIGRSLKIAASWLDAKLRPRKPEASFEDWIVNRFGRELYLTFFKTYTEKVWGMPCTRMSKDFAAQRIRDLSFFRAVKDALFPKKNGTEVKTLIRKFKYPRFGPGQLWEAVRDRVVAAGCEVRLGEAVTRIRHEDGVVRCVETSTGAVYEAEHFYSTMTLGDLVAALDPPPPPLPLAAGRSLKYRDFLTVALVVRRPSLFPDNWIYVHDPQVLVGRVQNYRNWSAAMVADPGTTCLGMEYFCNEGEDLWNSPDEELIRLGAREVEAIGLARAAECADGAVVRMRRAYPVYDEGYLAHRETLKGYLRTFRNLHPAGRGGLHSYNSQDHSMMAALYSVQNVREGTDLDPWAINTSEEYAEEGEAKKTFADRAVPRPVR
jgi:protoporphyrinogen oxidase